MRKLDNKGSMAIEAAIVLGGFASFAVIVITLAGQLISVKSDVDYTARDIARTVSINNGTDIDKGAIVRSDLNKECHNYVDPPINHVSEHGIEFAEVVVTCDVDSFGIHKTFVGKFRSPYNKYIE